MARIRTIKPEFFTSEDIVALSPLARLLYIATWCEADKEGRLAWKPRTMKLRYFPADDCDIDALARELVASRLVIPYGDGLAYIPAFAKHQHINPRESASTLPEPDASARVSNASLPVSDAQGGREGKGREGKGKEGEEHAPADASAPPADPKPKKPKRAEVTLATFAERCREAGEDVIPEDDPVFAYAERVGLPPDYVGLAWQWFKARYGPDGPDRAKRYADWRAHFRNAVKGGWPKFWGISEGGSYYLTTSGKQAQMESQS